MWGTLFKLLVPNVLDIVKPYLKTKAAKAQFKLALEQSIINGSLAAMKGQLDINKQEAKHQSIFVGVQE